MFYATYVPFLVTHKRWRVESLILNNWQNSYLNSLSLTVVCIFKLWVISLLYTGGKKNTSTEDTPAHRQLHLLWQTSSFLSSTSAFKEMRHPSTWHTEIDFRVTGRRMEDRQDTEPQIREMRKAFWPRSLHAKCGNSSFLVLCLPVLLINWLSQFPNKSILVEGR